MRVGRGLGACAAGGAITAAACATLGAGIAQAAEQRIQTFAFTGGTQQFVVPAGVTSLKVALIGGHGGTGSPRDGSESRGGEGESVLAQLLVIPGEPLFVEVAGNGESGKSPGFGRGGYGGGGDAESHEGFEQSGGGGGGASDVRTVEEATASRLVVAGGGGGGGGAGVNSTQPSTAFPGGSGGEAGARGQDGTAANVEAGGGEGGRPGGANSGGEAGGNSSVQMAGKGSEGVGGNGGGSGLNIGGGGGGGIFGGGGGGGGGSYEVVGQNFSSGGSGGGGGGASGVPAGSSASLLQEEASAAEPSVTFTWIAPPPAVLTGSASALTTTTATVNGTVNPDNSLVTACQFTIAPAPPAGATIPCAQQVGAGGSPVAVTAPLSDLSPATTYTVTLFASNSAGQAGGLPASFTTPSVSLTTPSQPFSGTGSSPPSTPSLTVTNLTLSPTRFHRSTRPATIAKQPKKKVKTLPMSTTISFALSQAATVALGFELAQPGVLAGGKCDAVSKTHRKGKRCTRYTAVRGGVTLPGHVGTDKITFAGVLDGGVRLASGTYRLSLGATGPGGSATAAQRPSFTLLG
jgi:hypothetical protein